MSLTLFMASLALSPVADEANQDGIDEIIVTARRREENLRDVPLAVSVTDPETLERAAAESLKDIAGLVPGLTTTRGQGMGATTALFIRGVGQNDSLQTFEQGVATYVDGVPLPRMQGLFMRLFDIEQIEVLRGPQGTLFGRNAVGGAVSITTRSPGDKLEGSFAATIGKADRREFGGYISGPLTDTTGISVAGIIAKRDGYYSDSISGKEYDLDDSYTLRAKLVTQPSDKLKITLAGDLTDMKPGLPAQSAEDDIFVTDLVFGQVLVQEKPAGAFDGDMTLSLSDDAGETFSQEGLASTIEWQLAENLGFTNVTAWKQMTSTIWWDLDGTPLVIADIQARWDQDQFSSENRFHYQGDGWDLVTGLFYMAEDSDGRQNSDLSDLVQIAGTPLGLSQPGEDRHESRTIAAFAHSTIALSDTVDLEAGLRWTRDKKRFERTSIQQAGGIETGRFEFPGDTALPGEDSWTSLTPTASLSWKASDTTNLYARVAKGFRSGGFNGRLSSAGDADNFRPETVWSFESGVKHNRDNIAVSAAAFYTDYQDFQARISRFADIADPSVGFNNPTVNAGSLRIYGVEGDVKVTSGNFTVLATAAWLHSSYGTFVDDSGDRSDNRPVFSPRLGFGLTASYRIDLKASGDIDLAAHLNHRSGYFTSVENSPNLYQPAHQLVNVAVRWTNRDELYVEAGIQNLTDEIVMQGGLDFRTIANIQTGYYGPPRNWRLSVGKRF